MGYKQSPALIVIVVALLLLTPLAYGQPVGNAEVKGRICCTSTGNCPPGSTGIPGVNVDLNCTTLSGTVETRGEDTTDSGGVFIIGANITLDSGDPIFTGPPPTCNVVANLPLNSTACPLLNTVNGTLTGATVFVGTGLDSILKFLVPLLGIVTVR